MPELIVYWIVLALSLAGAVWALVHESDRRPVSLMLAVSIPLMLVALWGFDSWMPFDGGGDDEAYFMASSVRFEGLDDWLNFSLYHDTHEQPGYPLVLTWLRQLIGDALYAMKAFNLMCLALVAVVWYAIVRDISDRTTALYCFGFVLFFPTMFFDAAVLHKDVIIGLLQGVFILSLVRFVRAVRCDTATLPAILVMASSTVALLPFRGPAAWINIGVAAVAVVALSLQNSGRLSRRLAAAGVAGAVLLAAAALMTSERGLAVSGVRENRAEAMATGALFLRLGEEEQGDRSPAAVLSFPLLFVLSDVSVFTQPASAYRDYVGWRGAMTLPWIAFGVLPMAAGAYALARNGVRRITPRRMAVEEPKSGNANFAAFVPILAFIGAYFVQCFVAGDTTRWRLPATPALAAVAAVGAARMPLPRLVVMQVVYLALLGSAVATYYAVLR